MPCPSVLASNTLITFELLLMHRIIYPMHSELIPKARCLSHRLTAKLPRPRSYVLDESLPNKPTHGKVQGMLLKSGIRRGTVPR